MTNHSENNEDRASRIVRYLGIEGEMTEEERFIFEQDLKRDYELKAEFELAMILLDKTYKVDDEDEETEEDPLALETEYEKQLYAVLSSWDWAKDIPSDEAESKSDEDVVSKDADQNEVENEDTTETNEIPFDPLAPSAGQVSTSSNETVHPASVEPGSASAGQVSTSSNETVHPASVESGSASAGQVRASSNEIVLPASVEPGAASAVSSSVPRRGSKFIYWLSGIAAVLVIGFFIGKSLWGGPEYKFEDLTPESEGVARGAEYDTIPDLLKRAEYEEALKKIESEMKTLEKDRQNVESLAKDTQKIKSDPELKGSIDYQLTKISNDSVRYLWFKGNALIGLKQTQTEEFNRVLDKLQGTPYYNPLNSLYHLYK